jgi:hypothetical protein
MRREPRAALSQRSALSADAQLLAALHDNTLEGHVHSVFMRVINVTRRDGQLYTLAGRGLDNAPNTAIIDTAGFEDACVRAGEWVTSSGAGLVLDCGLHVTFDGCDAFECALPSYPADDRLLRKNVGVAHRAIADGVWAHRWPGSTDQGTAAQHAVRAALNNHARDLHAALGRGDTAAACRHSRSLVGLGPGLTPSGDDFLVGVFAALHVRQSPGEWLSAICAEVMAGARERTNVISIAALEEAARGRVRESLQALVEALLIGNEASVHTGLARVLAIGSTSGRDMIAGVLCGLEAHLSATADSGRSDRNG